MGLFDNLVKQFNESGLKDELSKVGKEIGEGIYGAILSWPLSSLCIKLS